jgi:hypothetical protein
LGGPQSRSGRRGEEKILDLTGLELRPLRRPARSQPLYRLRYPGSFYNITTDLKSFFYIIRMKIQAPVASCDEFPYPCIMEICRQSIESVFNRLLHFFIATHARAAQKLLQVKGTWSRVRTVGRMKKRNVPDNVCG